MHLMLVLSNARPGREEEFNAWYSDVHVPDTVNKLDGVVSGRRFLRQDVEGGPDHPYRYLAVYEIPDDQLEVAQQQFLMQRAERTEALSAGREPLLPVSGSTAEDVIVGFFSPLGDVVVADGE